ncbi:MAG TPA: cobalt-precorrin-3B C(17)-methyltransferase, partial [Nitrospirota bacterium]
AASADFVIAIYNPRSNTRPDNLGLARDIILKYRKPETPVGMVKDSTREGETLVISTLDDMPVADADMTTLVIVGNSQTCRFLDYMVTPRGYKL